MEANDTNIKALCQYLENTLSPDTAVRKAAEKSLNLVEVNRGYAALLMAVLSRPDFPVQIRVACAVTLKNFVKRNWLHEERISESDRQLVKGQVLGLMLQAPDSVRRQLAETITLIGAHDFPDKWPTLVDEMVAKFSCGDLQVVNATLLTAHSLFRRYVHEMKSDRLWSEIRYVLDRFAAPLLALFEHLVQVAQENTTSSATVKPSPEQLKPVYEALVLVARIFYALNAQDLPEFFEDNMEAWMSRFRLLLSINVPCLRASETDDDEEAGVVEELWSQICDNIAMYAQKYDEEFSKFLPPFVQIVWQLLTSTGAQVRYDSLVSNAVQFLASVCEREQYKSLFADGDALAQICQRIIVPNVQLRPQDEELFRENPEEFIRRDIEGSDVDTRRRSAADLVRALCKHFEGDVIRIFSAYINELFKNYVENPDVCWPQKDAAVYLVETLTLRGQTAKLGATKTSQLVDLNDFYNGQIVSELTTPDVNKFPVLKAGALKFLVTFRSHISKIALLNSALPACVRLLQADSVVVHSYAAHTIERLISTRDPQNQKIYLIPAEQFKPVSMEILQNLFTILDKTGSTENEYATKCLMRCCWYFSDSIGPYVEVMLPKLTQKITLASKNPSKPFYNHYLFETLCLLIKSRYQFDSSDKTTKLFEDALFPPFQDILQQDVQEFMPYVFQVLALVLNTRPEKSGAPESYRALYPFLLVPALWEQPGNVPALVLLIQAFCRVDAEHIIQHQLNPTLGVFQKLLTSKSNDQESFKIVNALVEYGQLTSFPPGLLASILRLIFARLTSLKTPKLTRAMVHFSCLFTVRFGARQLVELFDSVQSGIFGMFLQKVMLVELEKGLGEKRVLAMALVKLLTEAPDLTLTGTYSHLWPGMLQALVGLLDQPEEVSGGDDNDELDVLGGVGDSQGGGGYSAAYSQLIYATPPQHDPCAEISETPKNLLARSLKKLGEAGFAGQISAGVDALPEQLRARLKSFLTA